MTSGSAPVTEWDARAVEFVLCDLDGVVWLRREALPGACTAVAELRDAGRRVVFVTNNSMSVITEQEAALAAIGIPAEGDVITSAQAAASLVGVGEHVLVCGGPGVEEAVADRGATPVGVGDLVAGGSDRDVGFDAVVVGLHQDFHYWGMQAANRAIRAGARFIATNDDATYPTPDGPIPGAGSIVAAVATAAGREPLIAGKPHVPMAELVAERCGPGFTAARTLMVGDRFSTDGMFAATIGCPFALVRTGVTPPGEDPGGEPALDVADLAAVADAVLAADGAE